MATGWREEFEGFPASLRRLVEAELAAGNAVAEVHHGFPAPPVGACLVLARPVSTRPRASDGVLSFRARESSLLSGEWSDTAGAFFVLEPPLPPAEPPDMDVIRAAMVPVAQPAASTPDAELEFDYRGEMLTYREDGRVATIICTFGDPPRLLPRTLNGWRLPDGQGWRPITPAERERVVKRIIDICRQGHGMSRIDLKE
ncbi:hypothetical protein [Neoroseomonas lacus]|uniref:Uncharacterized protein n=1 Tax=Neoroseomonas lacus TaxID=287609 RepID=A0A917K5Z6_9PROT|nr:hypothetical protein [Neoroseomonas lacus]GGI98733.1 hypothetical protein GCM10011320_01890 [Neoroseomonas lacus]